MAKTISSTYRVSVSGTPLGHDRLSDLRSLCEFLRIKPFCSSGGGSSGSSSSGGGGGGSDGVDGEGQRQGFGQGSQSYATSPWNKMFGEKSVLSNEYKLKTLVKMFSQITLRRTKVG